MRLSETGELIAETGFDGGSYTPRYESRTSVFLGDMSKEDIRIKKMVSERNRGVALQNAKAAAIKDAAAIAAYRRQEAHNMRLRGIEAEGAHQMEVARNKGYMAARAHANMADVNPWVGSPFAGFGDARAEQRINPDSAQDVQIVDTAIPSVSEYGINNWMEDPESVIDRVQNNQNSYTDGKVVMQTMVDYAQTPARSVVGMPVAAQGIVAQRQNVARVYADTFSGYGDANVPATVAAPVAPVAPTAPASNNMLKYGLLALAAYFLLD